MRVLGLCCHDVHIWVKSKTHDFMVPRVELVPRMSSFAFIRCSFIAYAVIFDEFLCLQGGTCENILESSFGQPSQKHHKFGVLVLVDPSPIFHLPYYS